MDEHQPVAGHVVDQLGLAAALPYDEPVLSVARRRPPRRRRESSWRTSRSSWCVATLGVLEGEHERTGRHRRRAPAPGPCGHARPPWSSSSRAGGAGRLAARAPRPAAAAAAHGRRLVLCRPRGPGPRRRSRCARHRAAPAHGPADRDVAALGRAPPPRQPRLRAAHPARPAEPHDRRPRRASARDGAAAFEHHAELPRRDLDGGEAPCSSATSAGSPRRPGATPSTWGRSWPCTRAGRWCPCAPTTSTPWWCSRAACGLGSASPSPACSPTSARGATSAGSTADARPAPCCSAGPVPRARPHVGGTSWPAPATSSPRPAASGRSDDGRFGTVRSALARIEVGPPPWE